MKRRRRGATTTQILTVVVLSIIVLAAFAVGTPLLLMSRENSRRVQCTYNLKQYGLGIHTYHDWWQKVPTGTGSKNGIGTSFQVTILPMMGQQPLYDSFRYSGDAIGSAFDNDFAAGFGDKIHLPYASCPSSPHAEMLEIKTRNGGTVSHQVSSYVGIAGTDNFQSADGREVYQEAAFAHCCSDLPEGNGRKGVMGVNGALPPNEVLSFGSFRDGLSNVIFMSEQAGWGRNASGRVRFDASSPHGWIAGTAEEPRRGGLQRDNGKSTIRSVFNLTTIVYQPGSSETDCPGVVEGHGPNNPLVSGHGSGMVVLIGDCSTKFLPYRINLILLKKLAVRADGLSLE
jgi:hypothetical protein